MENFTSYSSSSSLSHIPPISTPSSSAAFDDSIEDFCSICLEPFSVHDPSTVTSCKHEYHLHCILEWSQRSKECPICWQSLSLKDPVSQELLAAVEDEKRMRSRSIHSSSFTNSRIPLERLSDDHDDSCSDDSDFDEQIMRPLVAAANRARFVQRQERQRSPGAGPSEVFAFNSSVHVSGATHTTSPSGGSSPASGVLSTVDIQPPAYVFPHVADDVARNTTPETDVPYRPRVLYSQPLPESARRPNTSEMFSFPESLKSKFSAASAKYKESISKSTRGLKEKLLAHNASVKELSKGVQREMNASIAGVARMIERLDLTSKRSNSPLVSVHNEGTSGFPEVGKTVEENGIVHSPSKESGGAVDDVSSDVLPRGTNMLSVQVNVSPCVQSGPDGMKT
ncbi:hypothetical protein VNO77_01707 [Canavalia gladiata]|uniref:RING-type E3 ubiquitin transferase n=1 Tax=Canavalia gladiata TaxID=3824 RepID=A0AAN9MSB3_CANGL